VGVRPNEIGVRRINFEHFELLGGFARLRVQLQLGSPGWRNPAALLVLVQRVRQRRLDFSLKLSDVLTRVLKVVLLPLKVLDEGLSRRDQRVATKV